MTDRRVATLHLPMSVAEFSALADAITHVWPDALIQVDPDDHASPHVVVPDEAAPGGSDG